FSNEITHTAVLRKAYLSEVTARENTFTEDIDFVNKAFFEVFQLETLYGDIKSIFQDPNALALSEASALRWFGETDVVGESLALKEFFEEQSRDYDIVAVYRQPEGKSTLDLAAMGGLPVTEEGLGEREVYL